MLQERLHKFMARAGVASRRRAETMIASGRVKVNGNVVREMGVKIDPAEDVVEVDNRVLSKEEKKVYLLLNKPRGYVTTVHDPGGRPVVTDLVRDVPQRVYPVGRLDYNTRGLLLLTNDGALAHALTHPRHEIPKTYRAVVKGIPAPGKIKRMQKGLRLEDGLTAPAKVRLLHKHKSKSTLEITIHEGRNRQVRRMCEHIGHPVLDLERVRMGELTLQGVPRGKYRYLTSEEINRLKNKI